MPHTRIRESLRVLIDELVRLDLDLARLCVQLPEPMFEEETDRPLNAAAEIYGLLTATRQDELASAVKALQRALQLSAELTRAG